MAETVKVKVKQIDSATTSSLNEKHRTSMSCSTGKTLQNRLLTTEVSHSPSKKLRLDVVPTSLKSMNKKPTKNNIFIYGNYDRYYGYRNAKDFKDIRLDTFEKHRSLFDERKVLDIGCNNGLVTISVARNFNVKHIVGIDIDKNLVDKARNFLINEKRNTNVSGESFPFNIEFKYGNYVLADEKLLELEAEQFDTILCLSVTKWIHLNCGDDGMKLAFRRMYKQLLPGGRLILEAQGWKSYKRRKNLTPNIATNYKSIKFFPEKFDEYLLGTEVGFQSVSSIGVPTHEVKGFQRPIKVTKLSFFLVYYSHYYSISQ